MKTGIRAVAVATVLFAAAHPGATAAAARDHRAATAGEIKRIVMAEARRMQVPTALALAVAHVESGFDPYAESHAGARGVMQIMPATAMGEYGVGADRLWNPRINVRIGLHFLKRLIVRYGRTDVALSHYNGGSRVGPPGRARVLPYTRAYVIKVHRLAARYRWQIRNGRV
jgi:soluble lytic murein transglycosylase-like protein